MSRSGRDLEIETGGGGGGGDLWPGTKTKTGGGAGAGGRSGQGTRPLGRSWLPLPQQLAPGSSTMIGGGSRGSVPALWRGRRLLLQADAGWRVRREANRARKNRGRTAASRKGGKKVEKVVDGSSADARRCPRAAMD